MIQNTPTPKEETRESAHKFYSDLNAEIVRQYPDIEGLVRDYGRLQKLNAELVDNLKKTNIFLETVCRSVFNVLAAETAQKAFLEAHIEINAAALAHAEEGK